VAVIGQVLVQFVFRVTFGMALAMSCTSPRQVESGYYRVHLWVLMGLNTLATLAVISGRSSAAALADWKWLCGFAVGLALGSYLGAVIWLYQRLVAGRRALWFVAAGGLVAAVAGLPVERGSGALPLLVAGLDAVSGGLLLGSLLAAMLLGHWYLNTPTMQLEPLKRLLLLLGAAAVLRSLVAATGLALQLPLGVPRGWLFPTLLGFRWLSGILGALLIARMAWQTLKIPNTQSATGILYAGVVLVFLGELISQLLSVDALYPL
jgi:hypothetical protein